MSNKVSIKYSKECTVESCNNKPPYLTKGLCNAHYKRLLKYGDPNKQAFIINGKSKHPLYDLHKNIIERCYSKNSTHYAHYGGRGIKMCDRWRGITGFDNFVEDMGDRPSKNHSIDRINGLGDYTPENCRWATWHEQAANRSSNNATPGVSYAKRMRKWTAQLRIGKQLYYKRFDDYESAVKHRKELEIKYLEQS